MPSIKVDGMHCNNCKNAVEKAIMSVSGIEKAEVDIANATATWSEKVNAHVDVDAIKKAIVDIGFDVA